VIVLIFKECDELKNSRLDRVRELTYMPFKNGCTIEKSQTSSQRINIMMFQLLFFVFFCLANLKRHVVKDVEVTGF
jgi:hypothetical protein